MIDSPYSLGFQRMQLLTNKQKAAIHFKFIDLPQDEIYKATEEYLANLSEEDFLNIKPFNKGEVDLHNEIDVAMFGNARITQIVYAPESTTTAFKSSSIELAFGELEKVYLEAKKRRERDLSLMDYYN